MSKTCEALDTGLTRVLCALVVPNPLPLQRQCPKLHDMRAHDVAEVGACPQAHDEELGLRVDVIKLWDLD